MSDKSKILYEDLAKLDLSEATLSCLKRLTANELQRLNDELFAYGKKMFKEGKNSAKEKPISKKKKVTGPIPPVEVQS